MTFTEAIRGRSICFNTMIECYAFIQLYYAKARGAWLYPCVFIIAVGTIGEWLKLVPFFVRGRTVDWGRAVF